MFSSRESEYFQFFNQNLFFKGRCWQKAIFHVGEDEQKQRVCRDKENHLQDCSISLLAVVLNSSICRFTDLHSSFYQLSTHNQARRCICNCPVCSHSAAHIHHCLAENIHPSLSGEKQNNSHFPDHPNPLIFLMQHFWTEGPEHWLMTWAHRAGTAANLTSTKALLPPKL